MVRKVIRKVVRAPPTAGTTVACASPGGFVGAAVERDPEVVRDVVATVWDAVDDEPAAPEQAVASTSSKERVTVLALRRTAGFSVGQPRATFSRLPGD
jgi:hypothetical protein